jgi:tetratricopeptide (TPR) repeat protein
MRLLCSVLLWLAVSVAMAADDDEILRRLAEKARRSVLAGEHEEAVGRYETITRLKPGTDLSAAAWWEISRLHEKLGNMQESFDALQMLVTGQPGHFEKAHAEQWRLVRRMLDNLAEHDRRARLQGQKPPKLVQADKEALLEMMGVICRNGPHSEAAVQAHFARAMFMEREGRTEEALNQHEEFLELYPEHELADDAACQTAYIRYKQWRGMRGDAPRQRQAAQDALNWFLTRYPESERASLAFTCLREMQAAERRELESVARFYESRGKPEAARLYYRKLAEMNPELLKDDGPLRAKLLEAIQRDPAAGVPVLGAERSRTPKK